jgi:recombination protein RecR
MDPIAHLAQLLNELPGIGPRQSKRLAYAILLKPRGYAEKLSRLINEVKEDVKNCTSCFRYVSRKNLIEGLCSICRDESRDHSLLMVVSRDVDLQSMERSGLYDGLYFVLGGSVPVLEKNPQSHIRLNELEKKLTNTDNIKEVILAHNQTPEGEHTATIIQETIGILKGKDMFVDFNVSHLGRGLSTGTELEYSDNETLRNALRNRG